LLSNEFFPLRIHLNRFGWGFAPDPTGELTALPHRAGFKGPLRGRRGIERKEGRTRGGWGRGEDRGKREVERGNSALAVGDRCSCAPSLNTAGTVQHISCI